MPCTLDSLGGGWRRKDDVEEAGGLNGGTEVTSHSEKRAPAANKTTSRCRAEWMLTRVMIGWGWDRTSFAGDSCPIAPGSCLSSQPDHMRVISRGVAKNRP